MHMLKTSSIGRKALLFALFSLFTVCAGIHVSRAAAVRGDPSSGSPNNQLSGSNVNRGAQSLPPPAYVLATLFVETGGEAWVQKDGWASAAGYCTWFGVQCNDGGMDVIGLVLSNNNLTGPVPGGLVYLPSLQTLILAGNSLTGDIGPITNLRSLQTLDLGFNVLNQPLPTSVNLPSLTHLDLSHNEIPGGFGWVAGLSNLVYLNLSNNFLSGTLPASICNLGYIREIDVSNNELSGPIPANLGSLIWMWVFILRGNQFSGTLPPSVSGLAKMRLFDVSDNRLSGTLPSQLGGMTNTQILQLSFNSFSGTLPAEVANIFYLQQLLVDDTGLSGSIPTQIWTMTKLQVFSARGNSLSGSIPNTAGESAFNLTTLDLARNSLSGPVPATFNSLKNLIALHLELNCFAYVPAEVIARCENTTLVNGVLHHPFCNFTVSPGCFPSPTPLPNHHLVAISVGSGFAGALCIAATVLFVCRRRLQHWLCPPMQVTTNLTFSDALAYEHAISSLNKVISYPQAGIQRGESGSRARFPLLPAPLGVSLRLAGKVEVNVPPAKPRVPPLTLESTKVPPMSNRQSRTQARDDATTHSSASKSKRELKKGQRPSSAPAMRRPNNRRITDVTSPEYIEARYGNGIEVPLTPSALLLMEGTRTPQNMHGIARIASQVRQGKRPESATSKRLKRPELAALDKPDFIDSLFVPELPANANQADIAGAYLSAEVFKDIAVASSEAELLDVLTRVFVMKGRNVKINRGWFKQECSKHRAHFPHYWTGRVLEAYHDCLKRLDGF